jgi:hypothetical protein
MKRLYSLITVLAFALLVSAQHNMPKKRFSPEQYQAELEKFITTEACLTSQEAAQFFPVYKEMLKKQRGIFACQRKLGKSKPADEQGCKKAIEERDRLEVELRRIQEQYHQKFLEVLPASKVYDVIMAEDKFHRTKLKQWSHFPKPDGKKR